MRRRCAGLLGLLMLAIILPAQVHAESVTLDFETLPGGGEPPFGLLLRDQYAPNITFVPGIGGGGGADGGAMITHCSPTPGSQTLCTSARSGKSVIVGVPDRSDEFLIHPIAMEFGQPQRVVSMYLRYPLPADRTQVIAVVTAYDAAGSEVARDTQAFWSDEGWRRFTVGSASGPANIARVVVAAAPSVTGVPAYTPGGWVLVDDVTFEGEAPAAQQDTTAPMVTVYVPSEAGERIYYSTRVVEDFQLARVWMELIRADTRVVVERYQICGPGVRSCPAGPTGSPGFVHDQTVPAPFEGDFIIRVVAEDAAGNRGEAQGSVHAYVPAEPVVSALRVEVNQSVQNGLLVPPRPRRQDLKSGGSFIHPVAGKDTLVRYYLVGQGFAPFSNNVSRQLRVTVWRRDGTIASRVLGPNAGQRSVAVPEPPAPGSDEEYELL